MYNKNSLSSDLQKYDKNSHVQIDIKESDKKLNN